VDSTTGDNSSPLDSPAITFGASTSKNGFDVIFVRFLDT